MAKTGGLFLSKSKTAHNFGSVLALAVSVSTLGSALAQADAHHHAKHPLASSAMLGDWLGDTGVLTPARLQHLLDLANEDPEAKALIAQAMAEIGAKDLKTFYPLFSVGAPPSADGSGLRVVVGEFTSGDWQQVSYPLSPRDYFTAQAAGTDLATQEPYKSWIASQLERTHPYQYFVQTRSSVLSLNFFVGPKVRLPSQTGVADAYETLMHELTHMVHFAPQSEPDPSLYADADSFDTALIEMPGQELEARVAGIRYLTRMLGEVPYMTSLPVRPEDWFSLTGSLLRPAEELVPILQGYVGYHFPGVYQNRLDGMQHDDLEERGTLVRYQATLTSADAELSARASARLTLLDDQLKRISTVEAKR